MNKLFLFLVFPLGIFTVSCKKCDNGEKVFFMSACPATPQNPVEATLKKTWKVSKVTQRGQALPLYQSPLPGGQSNLEDYSRYRLAFATTSYRITERDGVTTSTGTWELNVGNNKIILDKGVAGKERAYDVESAEDTLLKLGYVENSQKTGSRDLSVELIPE
jgi:hypothetical protein